MIGEYLRNEAAGGALARFTTDLTAAARAGRLEPVRCRDDEVSRVIDILLRHGKNNPTLVGPAGVGKTAIAEGLAQRIASERVPIVLQIRALALARPRRVAGRHDLPRPVRGANPRHRRRDDGGERRDPVHRRAAQSHRARHRDRRGDGRGQHAQAGARARRFPRHRRHDERRVRAVGRGRPRARAAIPEGRRPRARRSRDAGDPPGAQGTTRAPSQRAHLRRGDPRGGEAHRPVRDRPLAPRQGDRRDRRGVRAHAGDREILAAHGTAHRAADRRAEGGGAHRQGRRGASRDRGGPAPTGQRVRALRRRARGAVRRRAGGDRDQAPATRTAPRDRPSFRRSRRSRRSSRTS